MQVTTQLLLLFLPVLLGRLENRGLHGLDVIVKFVQCHGYPKPFIFIIYKHVSFIGKFSDSDMHSCALKCTVGRHVNVHDLFESDQILVTQIHDFQHLGMARFGIDMCNQSRH